jgi:3-mercaptopyruvate sulfurtransferase SseA
MATIRKILCAAGAAAWLLMAPAVASGEAPQGTLVSARWLLENREREDVLVLDASPPPLHAAGHIPGAVSASFMSYGVKDVSPEAMQERFESWGVRPGRRVVVYDQGDPMWATRLFFDLHQHGFPLERLHVLDGGLGKWKEIGGPVTKEPTPAPPRGTFRAAAPREELRARLPEVFAASGDPARAALVEALDPDWHFGGSAFFGRGGHIPHAVMLPSKDFYNADRTFKSPEELRRMLGFLGVRPERPVIAYCGGGVAASVPWFALRFLLGHPDAKLYVESALEWVRDDRGLPVWTWDAPYLMRETAWLATWGGRTMRMYGVSNLSVIDVRPADDFGFGHVPFAVNIPAAVFREHLDSPVKLAELLARSGVGSSHEAVVDSGRGLDPDSALAFLLLERAGQAKVSVFVDSREKAVKAGLALATDADAKKTPARPATRDASARRDGALVDGAAPASGPYPRVFVATGKQPPARPPEGKVVHVPYTDLVDADGRPKAAKDLWKILSKAGVTRYAELVAIADDPGEAAVAYYILKLMGFPDVKVLVR